MRSRFSPSQVQQQSGHINIAPRSATPKRLGELLCAVDEFKARPITAMALKPAPLLFVRPGELRQARWRHIDFANAQWRIPAECMKSRVQHLRSEPLRKTRSDHMPAERVYPARSGLPSNANFGLRYR